MHCIAVQQVLFSGSWNLAVPPSASAQDCQNGPADAAALRGISSRLDYRYSGSPSPPNSIVF